MFSRKKNKRIPNFQFQVRPERAHASRGRLGRLHPAHVAHVGRGALPCSPPARSTPGSPIRPRASDDGRAGLRPALRHQWGHHS